MRVLQAWELGKQYFRTRPYQAVAYGLGVAFLLYTITDHFAWCFTVGCVSPWFWWHHLDEPNQAAWGQAIGTVSAVAGALWIDRRNRRIADEQQRLKRQEDEITRQEAIYNCIVSINPAANRFNSRIESLTDLAVSIREAKTAYDGNFHALFVSEREELAQVSVYSMYFLPKQGAQIAELFAQVEEFNKLLRESFIENGIPPNTIMELVDFSKLLRALDIIPTIVELLSLA